MNKRVKFPVSAQFELTESCPHRCFYCYNHFRESPSTSNMDTLEVIRALVSSDLFHITITGGEPLAERKGLIYALDLFGKNNIDVTLNSGLTLANRDLLTELKERGVLSVLTSAGSYEREVYERITGVEGTFEKFISSLNECKEVGLPVALNMVVHNENKNSVYQTGRYFAENFGIRSFCATPLIPPKGRDMTRHIISPDDYVRVLDDLIKLQEDTGMGIDSLHPLLPCILPENSEKYSRFMRRSCVGGISTLTISSKGEVRPCSHSDESYGNILEEDLRVIHAKMASWQNGSLIPPECKSCASVDSCRGGCRICAEATYGNIKAKDYFMTAPLLTKRKVSEREVSKIDVNHPYVININAAKIRKEPTNDFTIYGGIGKVSSFQERELVFLKSLSTRENIIPQQLSLEYGIPLESIIHFLRKLKSVNMLKS